MRRLTTLSLALVGSLLVPAAASAIPPGGGLSARLGALRQSLGNRFRGGGTRNGLLNRRAAPTTGNGSQSAHPGVADRHFETPGRYHGADGTVRTVGPVQAQQGSLGEGVVGMYRQRIDVTHPTPQPGARNIVSENHFERQGHTAFSGIVTRPSDRQTVHENVLTVSTTSQPRDRDVAGHHRTFADGSQELVSHTAAASTHVIHGPEGTRFSRVQNHESGFTATRQYAPAGAATPRQGSATELHANGGVTIHSDGIEHHTGRTYHDTTYFHPGSAGAAAHHATATAR